MVAQRSPLSAKIIVALDGSPAAAQALPVARSFAAQLGSRIEVLYVAPETGVDRAVWEALHRDLRDDEPVQIRSHVGDAAHAIVEAADEANAALLVLATSSKTGEPGGQLGSVAAYAVAHSAIPVLLVPPAMDPLARGKPFRRLLVPLDGTAATAKVLREGVALARDLKASLHLLHVASVQSSSDEEGHFRFPRYVDQLHHEWLMWAAQVMDQLCCPHEVPVTVFLRYGDIAGEIVRFAAEHEEDAIVLARRSRLEPGRALVLRRVLDTARCPVLVFSAREEHSATKPNAETARVA